MAIESTPKADPEDVDAEDVRDMFVEREEPLTTDEVVERFGINDEDDVKHLSQLSQSGIVEETYRSAAQGAMGGSWSIRNSAFARPAKPRANLR